jgi:hypothetical protein
MDVWYGDMLCCRQAGWSPVMFKRIVCAMVLGLVWALPTPASAQMT